MNTVINTGFSTPKILKFIDDYCINSITSQSIQDHYLIKALSLFPNNDFFDIGITELMNSNRIPKSHSNDLANAFILISETEKIQTRDIIDHFNVKIPEAIAEIKAQNIGKIVYSLARMNKGEPKNYKILESKILETNLTKLNPIDLGISCLGFGLIGMRNFCGNALSAVNDCFHKYQHIQYEDFSDTDQEEANSNKLILVNEQELEFTSEIPASSVVQMA